MIKLLLVTIVLLISISVVNTYIYHSKHDLHRDRENLICVKKNFPTDIPTQKLHNSASPHFNIRMISENCYRRWSLNMARPTNYPI